MSAGELVWPSFSHQMVLLCWWLLAQIQAEKDSSSDGELASKNLTMLLWIYGQHKMNIFPLGGDGHRGRACNRKTGRWVCLQHMMRDFQIVNKNKTKTTLYAFGKKYMVSCGWGVLSSLFIVLTLLFPSICLFYFIVVTKVLNILVFVSNWLPLWYVTSYASYILMAEHQVHECL